uniref:RING-type E3 ubiquitin transferase n=1 Tax=Oryza barthii TaxID=65489 RepID=A0A0D3G6L0_9ORYZ
MSTVAAPAVEDASKHWAPHGAVLTAFVVGINLLMVLLVFFYFWRFFSGKRGPPPSSSSMAGGADDEEAASSDSDTSPAASPRASWRRLREWPAGRRQQEEDIASSLPVSVYSSADVGNGKAAAECAVCIVEFRDGDLARLLPRCGHRFHADCVGAWLRLHSTCPLCRAAALPLPPPPPPPPCPHTTPKGDAAAHCPVSRRESILYINL